MPDIKAVPYPSVMKTLNINSVDTNNIAVGISTAGQRVHFWGCVLTGGTSVQVKSNETEVGAQKTTTGLALPLPRVPQGQLVHPYYQSQADGEILNVKPGASGLSGDVYYSIGTINP